MTGTNSLIRQGLTTYLTDAQLLAALLDTTETKAARILGRITLERTLQLNADELEHAAGVTQRQACTLAAAYARRTQNAGPAAEHSINCPEDLVNLMHRELDTHTQEELHVILLTTRNLVISQHMIYRGNVNSSVVRPAEILRPAILAGAPAIIITHNHPSGDPTPTSADIAVTKDIHRAAALMGINLLDHVVTAPDRRWTSMNEQKMLQPDPRLTEAHH